MRNYVLYISCLCVILMSCGGCQNQFDPEKWKITLAKDSKKPYGSYLAHNSLKLFFPGAEVMDLSPYMQFSTMEEGMLYNSTGTSLMILTGLRFNVSEKEWAQLQAFAREGNELVIFGSVFDPQILKSFNLTKQGTEEEGLILNTKQLTANKGILNLKGDMVSRFGHAGRSLDGYFEDIASGYSQVSSLKQALDDETADTFVTVTQTSLYDTTAKDTTVSIYGKNVDDAIDNTDSAGASYTETGDYQYDEDISYTLSDTLSFAKGKPNCLRIAVGRGHITLHAGPLVMSNFFLLQDNNINYLAGIWGALPKDINKIYWDDYLYHTGIETTSNALWKFDSTTWALLLTFFIAAVYILFQMKRRQRIVPIIAPLKNDSVSFVETVGRLYYNTGNNMNLAEKMVQQYLEWVRMNCYLNTSKLDEEFVQQLAIKTGQRPELVNELVNMVREIRLGAAIIDDAYLYQLYRTIQQFYKGNDK